MYHINASKERLKAVEILTVPGLFTIHRVDRATLPPWMHLYQANARGEATQEEIREAARLVRQAVRLVRDTL